MKIDDSPSSFVPNAITRSFFELQTPHCNDPGARGLIFQLFGKECDNRNLRVSENRKTKLLLFNGI